MDRQRKYFEEYFKFDLTSIVEKNSEATVCFVQRCALCWCWVCETFEVHTAIRAKAFQYVTNNLF